MKKKKIRFSTTQGVWYIAATSLTFSTADKAIAYCKEKGWEYEVEVVGL